MTITLHWWMVPALLVIAAVFFVWRSKRNADPCFGGIFEMFTAIALVLMAGMFLLGRYL